MFDSDRNVGRIYSVGGRPDGEWFWGHSFALRGRKTYAIAPSLEDAKAAFRAQIA